MKQKVKILLKEFPQTYSEELGINLKSKDSKEICKWFLASILFAARINETIGKNTYKKFEEENLTTAKKIYTAGWDKLVSLLDSGGYVRYDFKTSDKLLEVFGNLQKFYEGNLNRLYNSVKDSKDLEEKIKNLGKGIGDVTINIFLRELCGIWKVEPLPSKFTILAAKNLGLIKSQKPEKALKELKENWKRNKIAGKNFVNFETALLRLGKDFCRKKKCKICRFKELCP